MYWVACLLLLAAPVFAGSVSKESHVTTIYGCSTLAGREPHHGPVKTITVPSVAHTKTTIKQVITTTPTKTVRGRPKTTFTTSTSTSTITVDGGTVTGTYTSTSTTVSTTTSIVATSTSVTTVDSGTTVYTTTTSVTANPTRASQVAIYDSTGEQTRQLAPKKAREVAVAEWRAKAQVKAKSKLARPLNGNQYPQKVQCMKTVKTEVTLHSTPCAPTKTVTSHPTVTQTITTVSTSTSTTIAQATSTTVTTTTSTYTSPVTSTTTSTVTTTSTETTTLTSTAYDACGSGYLLGPALASGGGVDNFQQTNDDYNVIGSDATSGYDCCVSCQTSTETCYGSYYSAGQGCLLVINSDPNGAGGVCSPSYLYGNLLSYSTTGTYVVANGPCGQLGPQPT